jgi:HPt (histidine-containing phosphotransfer) domain-containing protein
MSSVPPPNDDLANLAALLGEDNVRMLVRTFLRDFPVSIRDMASCDRKTRHRLAHNLKSNARVVGARILSDRMAAIELRLSDERGADLDQAEITAIAAEFESVAIPLRKFAE